MKGRERVTLCRDARLVRPSPLQGYCVKIVRRRTHRSSVPTGRRINVLRQDRSTTDAQIVRPYRATYQCTASRSFDDGRSDRASLQGDVSMYCVKIVRRRTLRSSVPTGRRINVLRQDRSTTDAQIERPYRSRDRASARLYSPLRLSGGRRGLHSVVLELLGIEATYLSLALVHLPTGVLYIYVCGVLVEVGTLLRCDE